MRFLLFTTRKPLSILGSIGKGLKAIYGAPSDRPDEIAKALTLIDFAPNKQSVPRNYGHTLQGEGGLAARPEQRQL